MEFLQVLLGVAAVASVFAGVRYGTPLVKEAGRRLDYMTERWRERIAPPVGQEEEILYIPPMTMRGEEDTNRPKEERESLQSM